MKRGTAMGSKRITVEELSERWSWLLYEMGVSNLKVTESFKSGITKTFIVTGLTLELEDGYGFCFDCYDNEVLTENNSTLLFFLDDSLISIVLIPVGDGFCQERLSFGYKQIIIEKAS